jgi:hypothetical protein
MKFRKKYVVIDAILWDGTNMAEVEKFYIGAQFNVGPGVIVAECFIATMEGTMIARAGDWIIKGVKGEFYPCKPDIFAATYESAE